MERRTTWWWFEISEFGRLLRLQQLKFLDRGAVWARSHGFFTLPYDAPSPAPGGSAES